MTGKSYHKIFTIAFSQLHDKKSLSKIYEWQRWKYSYDPECLWEVSWAFNNIYRKTTSTIDIWWATFIKYLVWDRFRIEKNIEKFIIHNFFKLSRQSYLYYRVTSEESTILIFPSSIYLNATVKAYCPSLGECWNMVFRPRDRVLEL